MNPDASRSRHSTSKSRNFSPLDSAPKFSPPASRTVSPVRRPLSDRSNTPTNQFSGPTIRIVEEPKKDVYAKTPFPKQPSQILPPRKKPGYAFESRERRVSSAGSVANAIAKLEANTTLVPKPLPQQKTFRQSASTTYSDADTLVASSFSPSSSRFSTGSTPQSSIFHEERGLEKPKEEVPFSPSPLQKSTIRAVTPSTSSSGPDLPTVSHALTPRASATSLASTASIDTLARDPSQLDRNASSAKPETPNYHKHTSSSESTYQERDDQNQASSSPIVERHIVPQASLESFALSDYSIDSERPLSPTQPSHTIHAARRVSFTSNVQIHYPTVRAPSASSLWAESRENTPSVAARMNARASQAHNWSSQLSTIHSESERGSRSIERRSRSISGRSNSRDENSGNIYSHIPHRRSTIASISSSDNVSSDFTDSSVAVPLPLFSPVTGPSYDERDIEERQDTITPLQSPPLRNKRSFLRRNSDSRSNSSRPSSSQRPGSAQSDFSTFIHNTIPPWARVYYRRGERSSIGAPDSGTDASDSRLGTAQSGRTTTPSEGNFPLSIYRPRNRPHNGLSQPESMSLPDEHATHDVYVVGRPRRFTAEPFTPRLQKDRRSQARLSAWKAPSFDDSLGTLFFSRQNRQILLFCLGFIFPLAWMIASFLPLPPDPEKLHEHTPTPSQVDLEHQLTRDLGPIDDRSYQKAMWWRNLNRIMAAIGTLLIGVIVALGILASRMK